MSGAIRFGIVGGGWRAEFFLRIAAALPERFQIAGIVVRDAEKGRALELAWGVPTFRELGGLLAAAPSFVVVSVPRKVAPDVVKELAAVGMPALCETPPAETLEGMTKLFEAVGGDARIQVAEQYPFQPNHAARLAVVGSGKLGEVSSAQVSSAHDYHGLALIRRYLGVGFDDAVIRATKFESPITEGPGRGGPPKKQRTVSNAQTIATIDFGGKVGVYDFTGEQYFSWIHSSRVLVRGDRGEINDMDVRWLADQRTPLEAKLTRLETGKGGNLEGFHLKGILCGESYAYVNPFAPGRLADDEIAVATCLERMGSYAEGDDDAAFYGLAEACQDHYLGLMIQQAASSGETVRTSKMTWAIR